jgi:short subunit dehydrogenase-like uncharacterized protein
MTVTENQKRLVIVGATGMVGGYALRHALDDPAVTVATAIGRKPAALTHPTLIEVLHQTFATVPRSPTRSRFPFFQAWC